MGGLMAAVSVLAVTAGTASAQGAEKSFNIPAEPAAAALKDFARQSGQPVLAASADLNGVTTNAVTGSFQPRDALQRLVDGKGLEIRTDANGAMLVINARAQAAGGTAASAEAPAVPASDQVVVVTGFKKSYADAVRMKRSAVGITDSISSDGLGRFPDLNVGEAVQRIPGVQINREAGSRDATINLRGLPGTYARTTLNGLAFAEPILDSSTPLGAFNSDIFSAISIIKSPSAADQPGGLSGNVDLQIAPALGRKDGGFFKLSNEYDTLGKLSSPAFTLGYNKHFSPDLAVFGVVAFKDEKFRRDSINFPQYTALNPNTTPNFLSRYADYYAPAAASCPSGQQCTTGGTGLLSKAGVFAPTDVRQVVKYNEGTLVTAAGGVEYKPNDNLKLGVSGFLTERDLKKNYTDIIDIDMRNALTVINPTSAPFKLADGNYYVNQYTFSNTSVYDSFRSEPLVEKTWGLNANADWKSDDWRLSAVLTASQAENDSHQTQLDGRNMPKAAGNGTAGSFFSGGDNIENYALSLTAPNPAVAFTSGEFTSGVSSGPSLTAPNGDIFIVAGSQGTAKNTLNAAQVDLERYLANYGWVSSVQFGARVEQDKYLSHGYRTSAVGVQYQNIDNSFVRQSDYAGDFFGGVAGGYLTNWQTINYDTAVSKLQPVTVPAGATLTDTGWINDPTNGSFFSNNFTNANDIFSAYTMAKLKFDLFGIRVRGNTGVRYEQTDNTITSLDKNSAGVFVNTVHKRSYHNLLPSLLLSADLTDDLVLRGAAYATFVRPSPRQVSPATIVSGSANTGFTVSLGNLGLNPYRANSYDLSLEWYNRPNGVISIDFFRKDVQGIITAVTDKSTICPSDATAWGLGHLSWNGTACVSDLTTTTGTPATVAVSGNYNSPRPLRVSGIEFNVQQNLDFLPGFWKNFGGAFNYSYTTIAGGNPDGSKAILPGVSKNNYNFIAFYETPKFGIRAVYNYRDEYILSGGSTFSGGPSIVGARGQLDISASYNINARFSLSLDAFNLTDARRTQYQNEELMPRANDYDGRTYTLSLHGTF
ncbi:TonB-dependent receptor [Asticcacaulis solisilvae]|uniref:TonB-dependent receptor n=1 Tax=Asticcacaulis solisilvae TaxID=1217274 RepID=UPI003FD6E47C